MDNRRPPLFGTPLSKCLENESSHGASNDHDHVGPINRRLAKLDKQQIVTDDQGRRRFHGAFTGGFSAGHFNSVDTSKGFQPKSFISKRGSGQDDHDRRSAYDHRPEDYMDDEDFGEFGIAPKKIRLAGEYSKGEKSSVNASLRHGPDSIGEKILRTMTGASKASSRDENAIDDLLLPHKNDYHGLGYKPLSRKQVSTGSNDCSTNPLTATLEHGQKLKITGEAFGEGVLDDDDDTTLQHANEYGVDSLANYDFSSRPSKKQPKMDMQSEKSDRSQQGSTELSCNDRHALDDFTLARDVESLDICGDLSLEYPRPVIDANWKMPVRDEPYVPPHEVANPESVRLLKKQAGEFSEKFVGSKSTVTDCDNIEDCAGLVQYSDLKAVKSAGRASVSGVSTTTEKQNITISRETLEWRPCSLLCKHFNVTNPYPDNSFCGVKPSVSSIGLEQHYCATGNQGKSHDEPAPLELCRSIFNVCFDEATRDADDELDSSDDEQPQVIELDGSVAGDHEMDSETRQSHVQESDHEPEVIVVAPRKPTPEVINLLSSSSSDETDDDDDDAYGPPLPPTRRTLQAAGRSAAARSSSQSSVQEQKARLRRKKKKKKN